MVRILIFSCYSINVILSMYQSAQKFSRRKIIWFKIYSIWVIFCKGLTIEFYILFFHIRLQKKFCCFLNPKIDKSDFTPPLLLPVGKYSKGNIYNIYNINYIFFLKKNSHLRFFYISEPKCLYMFINI